MATLDHKRHEIFFTCIPTGRRFSRQSNPRGYYLLSSSRSGNIISNGGVVGKVVDVLEWKDPKNRKIYPPTNTFYDK